MPQPTAKASTQRPQTIASVTTRKSRSGSAIACGSEIAAFE